MSIVPCRDSNWGMSGYPGSMSGVAILILFYLIQFVTTNGNKIYNIL